MRKVPNAKLHAKLICYNKCPVAASEVIRLSNPTKLLKTVIELKVEKNLVSFDYFLSILFFITPFQHKFSH